MGRVLLLAVVVAMLVGLLAAVVGTPRPALAAVGLENRVRDSDEFSQPLVGPPESVSADQGRVSLVLEREIVVATGVAANAGSGADNVSNARRLQAKLAGEELAGADGNAFVKHVVEQGEFRGSGYARSSLR